MFLPEEMDSSQAQERNFEKWKAPTEQALRKAFDQFDIDGNGRITEDEIKISLRKYWGIEMTDEETESMMLIYDADENGSLDYDEFACMVKNLGDDLDPQAVSRFWAEQLAAIKGGERMKWIMNKIKSKADAMVDIMPKGALKTALEDKLSLGKAKSLQAQLKAATGEADALAGQVQDALGGGGGAAGGDGSGDSSSGGGGGAGADGGGVGRRRSMRGGKDLPPLKGGTPKSGGGGGGGRRKTYSTTRVVKLQSKRLSDDELAKMSHEERRKTLEQQDLADARIRSELLGRYKERAKKEKSGFKLAGEDTRGSALEKRMEKIKRWKDEAGQQKKLKHAGVMRSRSRQNSQNSLDGEIASLTSLKAIAGSSSSSDRNNVDGSSIAAGRRDLPFLMRESMDPNANPYGKKSNKREKAERRRLTLPPRMDKKLSKRLAHDRIADGWEAGAKARKAAEDAAKALEEQEAAKPKRRNSMAMLSDISGLGAKKGLSALGALARRSSQSFTMLKDRVQAAAGVM